MNEGIIASRYASAFLQLVRETGSGERVVPQVETLLKAFSEVPGLKAAVTDQAAISPSRKMSLLEAALGESPMEEDLRRFINLLITNKRIGLVADAFRSFILAYYRSKGIRRGVLKVAAVSEGTAGLVSRLKELLESDGCTLEVEVREDPGLIGGFVFDLEDSILDASVAHQLAKIRKHYVEHNRLLI